MKVLVAVKRVVDPAVRPRVRADGSAVDTANVKMALNPFDEIALEEALRLKERGVVREVVAVSMGGAGVRDSLLQALALGADRGILVETDSVLEPLAVAKLLAKLVAREAPGLVLLGKQAIDDDCGQTPQMLAGLLGWAQATNASELHVEEGTARVVRETDAGREILRIKLPAVVSADLRLNQPRLASLPAIMKARQKPLERHTPEQLGIDTRQRLQLDRLAEPSLKRAGVKLASMAELVDRLRNEAKVL
ncbi:MAG: electron transfer flavoprotein subunit beta/FixA family protein [Pseudomonadota bacterium]|nr:MAG: electron transfer flavoprotein subunit beta/FixA family protein [Pseudomonadota bacterium]